MTKRAASTATSLWVVVLLGAMPLIGPAPDARAQSLGLGYASAALAAGDADGDGIDDVVIGMSGSGASPWLGGFRWVPGAQQRPVARSRARSFAANQLVRGSALDATAALGQSVAMGDFDGDGHSDVALGAPYATVKGLRHAGAVLVVPGSPAGPDKDSVVVVDQDDVPGRLESGDLFGLSLAVGDFNIDGFDDLAIGSPGEAIGDEVEAGAVWIVYGSSNGLDPASSVTVNQDSAGVAGRAEAFDHMGWSLAVGDIDGDGVDDLAIGVPGEDLQQASQDDRGMVHLFFGEGASPTAGIFDRASHHSWTKSAVASARCHPGGTASPGSDGARFGWSLAVADFDSNGFGDLAIGAPWDRVGGIRAGTVNVVYHGPAGDSGIPHGVDCVGFDELAQGREPLEERAEDGDGLGLSLATVLYNDDKYPDLAIGAPLEKNAEGRNVGWMAIVRSGRNGLAAGTSTFTQWRYVEPEHADVEAYYGRAFAVGDFDGHPPNDERQDLLVSLAGRDRRNANRFEDAAVLLYNRPAGGYTVAQFPANLGILPGAPAGRQELHAYQNAVTSLKNGTGGGLLIAPRLVLTAGHNGYRDPALSSRSCNWGPIPATSSPGATDVEFGVDTDNQRRLDGVGFIAEYDYRANPALGAQAADGQCTSRKSHLHDLGVWALERPTGVAEPLWNPAPWDDGGTAVTMLSGKTDNMRTVGPCRFARITTHEENLERFEFSACDGFAYTLAGDSGSPVFDAQGRLVGVMVGSGGALSTQRQKAMRVWTFKDWIEERIEEQVAHLLIGRLDDDPWPDFYYATEGNGDWIDLSSQEAGAARDGLPTGGADEAGIRFCAGLPQLADLEQDGVDDLVCLDTKRERVTARLLGPGGSRRGAVFDLALPDDARWMRIADFDGDGYPDLLIHASPDRSPLPEWGYFHLFVNRSEPGAPSRRNGIFRGGTVVAEGPRVRSSEVLFFGEFDADGRAELFYYDRVGGYIAIWDLADGSRESGHYQPLSGCGMPPRVADLDGDGDLDVLCHDRQGRELSVYLSAMARYPELFDAPDLKVRDFDWCAGEHKQLLLWDMDLDRKADLVCYDNWSGVTEIDYNLGDLVPFDGKSDLRTPDFAWNAARAR